MAGASSLTTLGAIPPFLVGAQGVWLRADLEIGLGMLGVSIGAFFGAAAVGAVAAGAMVDRLGRRAGRVLAGALVGLGGSVMAGLVQDAASLVACMVLLGLGNAACQTTANLAMARALPPHRRGLGFGVKQSAIPLAIMLGGLAVPALGATLGWRSTFVTTALGGASVAITALVHRPAAAPPAPDPDPAAIDRPPWPPLLLCGLAITCASAAANFLGAFVASWAFEVGLGATAAGLVMAAGSAGSIVVRIGSGFRADQRSGRNLPVVAAQMYVGAASLLGLAVAKPASVVAFGFLAFAVGWAWPGLLLFAVARVGRDRPGRAAGVIQAGAFVGGSIGPVALGALAGQAGFPAAWLVGSGLFVVAGTLVLLGRRGFVADLRSRPPRTPITYGGRRHARAG